MVIWLLPLEQAVVERCKCNDELSWSACEVVVLFVWLCEFVLFGLATSLVNSAILCLAQFLGIMNVVNRTYTMIFHINAGYE